MDNETRRSRRPTPLDSSEIGSWVHFGDLHIKNESETNYRDFVNLIEHANRYLAQGVNFAVLPGDNADDGTEEQYDLVYRAVERLEIPLFAIPGDHDRKSGRLDAFRRYLEPTPRQAFSLGAYQFVFLNSMEADAHDEFDFTEEQVSWLAHELGTAELESRRPVLFMHTYPSELGRSAGRVQDLLKNYRVLLVEMGHTHYNELANDGHTIYAATRSTGQIEEGPVGFSVANLDRGVVSWKFKPLGAWPFVMITSPIERRLITEPEQQVVRDTIQVRAKVWSAAKINDAALEVDNGPAKPMASANSPFIWSCQCDSREIGNGEHQLTVEIRDSKGNSDRDSITVWVSQDGSYPAPSYAPGDSANAIGPYPSKGILGTQLGPNKNGRKW